MKQEIIFKFEVMNERKAQEIVLILNHILEDGYFAELEEIKLCNSLGYSVIIYYVCIKKEVA